MTEAEWDGIAEIVGRTRAELLQRMERHEAQSLARIERLEYQLLLERRMSTLEARNGGCDPGIEFDLPNWRADQ